MFLNTQNSDVRSILRKCKKEKLTTSETLLLIKINMFKHAIDQIVKLLFFVVFCLSSFSNILRQLLKLVIYQQIINYIDKSIEKKCLRK